MDFFGYHNQFLLDMLLQHGVAAELRGVWIFPDLRPSIPLQALAFRGQNSASIVVLFELRALLPDGRTLIETIAGFGGDDEAALKQAQTKFLANPFHPLIEGLLGASASDQVTREDWELGGVRYCAYLSPCQQIGERFAIPAELGERVQAWAAAQPHHDAEFHWCRVFWSGSVSEVLWDNAALPQPQRELAELPWPELDGYASLRLFVLLRGPAQADSRPLEIMDAAVQLFVEHDDDDAYWSALEREATPGEAQLATEFMQIAFGRALIAQLFPIPRENFTDEFNWSTEGEIVGRELLSAQPLYRAALRAVQLADFETLEAIGMTSPEFNALNAALHDASDKGIKPDDRWFAELEFSLLTISRPPSDA